MIIVSILMWKNYLFQGGYKKLTYGLKVFLYLLRYQYHYLKSPIH